MRTAGPAQPPSPAQQWHSPLDIPARSVTGRSLWLVVCARRASFPTAQPRPQRHRQRFVSASVQCLHFPRVDPGDGTSSVGTLAEPPPPCRRDEPNGLGRRKVPDKRVLAPQPAPRGAATIPMQIHGVITPGRSEIRHCLVPDKPSQL